MLLILARFYHGLSHLSTLYPASLIENIMSMTTSNLVPRILKLLSHSPTSYHLLLHLITLYPAFLIEA